MLGVPTNDLLGGAILGIVEPGWADARALQQLAPRVVVAVRVDRAPESGREYPVPFLPLISRLHRSAT